MIFFSLTSVVANGFYVDRMVFLLIDVILLILAWPSYSYVRPVHASPGNPPFKKNPSFICWISAVVVGHWVNSFHFWVSAADTSQIICDTADFVKPTVSPITWKERPEAKKHKATRTWTVVNKAWLHHVCHFRSSSRSSTNICILAAKTKPEFAKAISWSWNLLCLCTTDNTLNSKSAMLFVLKNFIPQLAS